MDAGQKELIIDQMARAIAGDPSPAFKGLARSVVSMLQEVEGQEECDEAKREIDQMARLLRARHEESRREMREVYEGRQGPGFGPGGSERVR